MTALRIVLSVIALGALASCSAATAGGGQGAEPESTARVDVQNRRTAGAHVYVRQDGHLVPLGFVGPMSTRMLEIPPPMVRIDEPMRLMADVLGSTDWFESDAVTVRPQDQVTFTVESDLSRSSVSVRD